MKEIEDLIKAWKALPENAPAVLATVVGTSGSTYRRPGARMLISERSWLAGSISGGCLESDVLKSAWERTKDGPALVTYDTTAADDIVWGFGLGCNGVVQVLMERVPTSGGILALLDEYRSERKWGLLATVVSDSPLLGKHILLSDSPQYDYEKNIIAAGTGMVRGNELRSVDGNAVLYEVLSPPQSLMVFGAGHDAIPLVAAAKAIGWHVSVVDGRSQYLKPDRFPEADELLAGFPHEVGKSIPLEENCAAVVMTHNYLHDLELLKRLLSSKASYIGLLGPRRRGDKLISELGYSPLAVELSKLHYPIGIDIGAEGPDEIALAIVAEIQAYSRRRGSGFLRDSQRPLHEGARAVIIGPEGESPICRFLA